MRTKTQAEIKHLQGEIKFLKNFDTDLSLAEQKRLKLKIKELREEVRGEQNEINIC